MADGGRRKEGRMRCSIWIGLDWTGGWKVGETLFYVVDTDRIGWGGGEGVCVGVYMYNVQSYTEERGGGGIALPRRRGLTPPLYL